MLDELPAVIAMLKQGAFPIEKADLENNESGRRRRSSHYVDGKAPRHLGDTR